MPPALFDPVCINRHLARAKKDFSNHHFLIAHTWHQIIDRLKDIRRDFKNILILGDRGADTAAQTLKQLYTPSPQITIYQGPWELSAPSYTENSFDLILSVFDLHKIDNIQEKLLSIRTQLKEDGVFLASFPGNDSLKDLRAALMQAEIDLCGGASARVHPMITCVHMSALMQQAGFALPVVDTDHIIINYKNFHSLMYDLRGMGEANALLARSRRFLPRHFFDHTANIYRMRIPDMTVKIDLIHVIGWAPSNTQQKPLKPRSSAYPFN